MDAAYRRAYGRRPDYGTLRGLQPRLDHQPPWWAPQVPAHLAPGYSLADAVSYPRAAAASSLHFFGEHMDRREIGVDLAADFTSFDVPIFMFQCEDDWNTPAVLAPVAPLTCVRRAFGFPASSLGSSLSRIATNSSHIGAACARSFLDIAQRISAVGLDSSPRSGH